MISDSDVPSFFFCVTFLTKEVPRMFLLTKAPVKLHKKLCCFGVNKSQQDYYFVEWIVQTKNKNSVIIQATQPHVISNLYDFLFLWNIEK